MSETAKHRNIFLPFCQGTGLDIGFGGSPIVDTAICLDLPEGQRYSFEGNHPQHISCDCRNLYMFADKSLDYVYSSHVLEDFTDTMSVLKEWTRVIKIGGYLLLLLPDEQVYRFRSKTHNVNHKHSYFNLQYILALLKSIPVNVVYSEQLFENNDYNFAVIAKIKG